MMKETRLNSKRPSGLDTHFKIGEEVTVNFKNMINAKPVQVESLAISYEPVISQVSFER